MQIRTMTALAVLMFAAASLPAAAQERVERGGRGGGERRAEFRQDGGGERPHRGDGGQRRQWNGGERTRAPEAAQPPRAAEAPRAPEPAQAPRARRAGPDGQEIFRSDRQRGQPNMNRPGRWVDRDGDDRTNVSPADRVDQEDRDEARDARRWNGGDVQWDGRQLRDGGQGDRRGDRSGDRRDGDRRWDGDRDGRRDGDRDGRRDGERRWDGDDRRDRDGDRHGWDGRWSREDRDRWDRNDRDRDRRRGDRAYWSQGRYPFSYHSTRRYRGPAWIAPSGFYLRTWSMGDYLPWGWYGASYRLNDWWSYGLPWPPPGYDWVRNGPDVLLVDRFSGRIVQVVRMVFW
jgi:hypothetical protein